MPWKAYMVWRIEKGIRWMSVPQVMTRHLLLLTPHYILGNGRLRNWINWEYDKTIFLPIPAQNRNGGLIPPTTSLINGVKIAVLWLHPSQSQANFSIEFPEEVKDAFWRKDRECFPLQPVSHSVVCSWKNQFRPSDSVSGKGSSNASCGAIERSRVWFSQKPWSLLQGANNSGGIKPMDYTINESV